MGILKKFQKKLTQHKVFAVIGLIGLFILIRTFTLRKGMSLSGMSPLSPAQVSDSEQNASAPEASEPLGQNEDYAQVVEGDSQGLAPSAGDATCNDPADLLPADQNNEWAKLNPAGAGDLNNVNLLKAGYHNGIDTVGSSLRNANLQVRSEPPNPTDKVSPWSNTTIEPDLMRPSLELGSN